MILSSADEVDDLDLVAVGDRCLRECFTLEHDEIAFHRHAARVDVESIEELADRERAGDLMLVAVQCYLQFTKPILAIFG